MKHVKPVKSKHEVDLQERRLERKSEDHQLDKLKERLQTKLYEEQQPALIARAS